ncbi:MAG: acyl carrier protein [Clostridiales bacterium]|nr:acyl carrier protein [Clostridiales bacterium]
MEKLLEILSDIRPDVDFENCESLIDEHLLDSLSLISLIAELEDEYDITIPTVEIKPDNFNSAKRIYDMIERLQKEF